MENSLFDTVGLIVALFVSVVVWGTLIAGLYQIVREEVHQARTKLHKPRIEGSAIRSVEA